MSEAEIKEVKEQIKGELIIELVSNFKYCNQELAKEISDNLKFRISCLEDAGRLKEKEIAEIKGNLNYLRTIKNVLGRKIEKVQDRLSKLKVYFIIICIMAIILFIFDIYLNRNNF